MVLALAPATVSLSSVQAAYGGYSAASILSTATTNAANLIASGIEVNSLVVDTTAKITGSITAASATIGGVAIMGLPPGMLTPYAGTAAPSGWLSCDGSVYSRTAYAPLYAAIGTTWGAGDGSTTFSVPDMRGRFPTGSGVATATTSARTVGSSGGAETYVMSTAMMPTHSHGVTDPGHSHTIPTTPPSLASGGNQFTLIANYDHAYTTDRSTTGVTIQNNGFSSPYPVLPPFTVLLYIIKT